MMTTIDHLTSGTGWTSSDPLKASVHAVNEIQDFIAGNLNTKSLILKFDGASGQYLEKVLPSPVPMAGLAEMVMSVFSRRKRSYSSSRTRVSDFYYKVTFDGTREFLLPLGDVMHDVTFDGSGMTSVTKIRITCLHDDEDYLFISEAVAVIDEYPLDIFKALQEKLGAEVDGILGANGIAVATVASAAAGAKSIVLAGDKYFVDKYAVCKLKDLAGEELIQLWEHDEKTFKISPRYSPSGLVRNYTSATLYIRVPIVYNMEEDDAHIPGIALWGVTPTPTRRDSRLEEQTDSFGTDGSSRIYRSQIQTHEILLDLQARHDELVQFMANVVKRVLGREVLYINGRRHEVDFSGPPTAVEPTEAVQKIAKLQYSMTVEVKEKLMDRVRLPLTTAVNTTYNFQ
jgi:hypothetical protein